MSHNWGNVPESPGSYDKVGSNTGRLIANDEHYDRYSGQPRMSNIPVAIDRAEPHDSATHRPAVSAVST